MKVFQPRTIRGQLMAGLLLLEFVFLLLFGVLLIVQQRKSVRERAYHRLENQATLISVVANPSLADGNIQLLSHQLQAIIASRAILAVRITDPDGKSLAQESKLHVPVFWHVRATDLAANGAAAQVLPSKVTGDQGEAIMGVRSGNRLLGYVWVMEDPSGDRATTEELLRSVLTFGLLNLIACIALSALLARSITRPLTVLTAATRRLIRDPETEEGFPLEMSESNEAADVAHAFNLLVSSMAAQRGGLNDTLKLLDSMLANAPVGFAFFDREYRFVRVNRFLSEATGIEVQQYLGRSAYELFEPEQGAILAGHIDAVFATGMPVHDQDFRERGAVPTPEPGVNGMRRHEEDDGRSWFLNLYPVRFEPDRIRWVGAVFIDVTVRKRAEDALRKSEKLAAAGRLAASIAHEINNPLESVTNLLYLLHGHPSLDEEASSYAQLAQQEVARVSEMAQRTLRFYRQSTLAADANVAEILDSVLSVYRSRFAALHTGVMTRFDRHAELFCFSGELRQVFANLIGNALDASRENGRLLVRASCSHCRKTGRAGVRITVADTGSGMPESVRRRIFEPFFTTKDATGTGLGLWISLEILEKHGATIAVKSRQASGPATGHGTQGRSGTVFSLFFPKHGLARRSSAQVTAPAEIAASV